MNHHGDFGWLHDFEKRVNQHKIAHQNKESCGIGGALSAILSILVYSPVFFKVSLLIHPRTLMEIRLICR